MQEVIRERVIGRSLEDTVERARIILEVPETWLESTVANTLQKEGFSIGLTPISWSAVGPDMEGYTVNGTRITAEGKTASLFFDTVSRREFIILNNVLRPQDSIAAEVDFSINKPYYLTRIISYMLWDDPTDRGLIDLAFRRLARKYEQAAESSKDRGMLKLTEEHALRAEKYKHASYLVLTGGFKILEDRDVHEMVRKLTLEVIEQSR